MFVTKSNQEIRKKLMSDPELIASICSKDSKKRSTALEVVCKDYFPNVEVYIINNSGSLDEAKDVFQDGIMILHQNLLHGKFKGNSTLKTYVFSICKNLWLQELRKKTKEQTIKETFNSEAESELPLNLDLLRATFNELKEDCKQLLTGFYYEKKSISELQKATGMNSEQVVKNKKARCLGYLMKIIEQRNISREMFYE